MERREIFKEIFMEDAIVIVFRNRIDLIYPRKEFWNRLALKKFLF